ncbi:MAG: GH116 family glycosyl hydrolase [Sulfolobaceae archaeon]|nr:GH116 family glycosyl hydrolase [Sulfolobaceae archaeon]
MILKDFEIGIPIGAIGTGKIDFFNDLTIGNITIMNNWTKPFNRVRGFHIVDVSNKEPIFLQLRPEKNVETPPNYNKVKEIVADALFPRITYTINDGRTKIKKIEVSSILVKNDLKNSSLPAIFIKVEGEGKIAISFPNITGSFRGGRVNLPVEGKVNGVLLTNLKAPESDPAKGEIFLGCKGCHIMTNYRYWIPAVRGMTEDISYFYNISDVKERYYIKPYAREEIGGIVWKEVQGEETFILSWFFNSRPYNYPYGHYYENWFKSAIDVAEYAIDIGPKELEIEAEDEWLKEAMRNSLYILTTTSWLTKDGRLGVYEDPEITLLMNTIGSFTYDGLGFTLLNLYPDFVVRMDEEFGKYLKDGGEVPHDLGENSLDEPIYGASEGYPWNDLGPTWILMLYRDYKVLNDIKILERNYDKIKAVIDWLISKDKDGDCIPDSRGGYDNSYDGTHMYGTSSYIASLFLASLTAFINASKLLGKPIDGKYIECLNKGKKALESLWNGRYFNMWKRGNEVNQNSLATQIIGQFWCDILDLEPIISEDKILKTLKSIYELNYRSSQYCLSNGATPDGKIDTETDQMKSCWPRTSFAVASHMILRGLIKEGEEIAKREWNTIIQNNPWNQTSRIWADTGKNTGLPFYIGSTSVWLVNMALRKIKGKPLV